jgi:hypothetical protein
MAAGMKTAGSRLNRRRTDSVTGDVGWRGRLGGHRFCKRKDRRSNKAVVKLDFRRTCKQCFEDSETKQKIGWEIGGINYQRMSPFVSATMPTLLCGRARNKSKIGERHK